MDNQQTLDLYKYGVLHKIHKNHYSVKELVCKGSTKPNDVLLQRTVTEPYVGSDGIIVWTDSTVKVTREYFDQWFEPMSEEAFFELYPYIKGVLELIKEDTDGKR
jgi:hypothetical protein